MKLTPIRITALILIAIFLIWITADVVLTDKKPKKLSGDEVWAITNAKLKTQACRELLSLHAGQVPSKMTREFFTPWKIDGSGRWFSEEFEGKNLCWKIAPNDQLQWVTFKY